MSINLSATEWASWVQAIGSIAAIVGAALVAVWQSRKQHQTSLAVLSAEHRLQREDIAKALLVISYNTSREVTRMIVQLHDRETVHSIAEKRVHFDFNEMHVLERAILGIPLHNLPPNLIGLTMILGSTVRQFRENVETMLERHRSVDAAGFSKFFKALDDMKRALERVWIEIDAEVKNAAREDQPLV